MLLSACPKLTFRSGGLGDRFNVLLEILLDRLREDLCSFLSLSFVPVIGTKLQLHRVEPIGLMAPVGLDDVPTGESGLLFAIAHGWEYSPTQSIEGSEQALFSRVGRFTETLLEPRDGFSVRCSTVKGLAR